MCSWLRQRKCASFKRSSCVSCECCFGDGNERAARVAAVGPRNNAKVHHIFSKDFNGWPSENENIAVVGGGISAGQVALRLVSEGHNVHLVSRHSLREHQFDSDPGWLGPKFMASFDRELDVERRRELISKARHKGSVPPDVKQALRLAIRRDELQWHEDEASGFVAHDADTVELSLISGTSLKVNRILLATGFAAHRPGGKMIDELVKTGALPCASCGYPIVDKALRWHPRLFVSGPLAELELGPSSRNISGARRAGDRLVETVRQEQNLHVAQT